jgi:hypothetical protein
VDRPGCCARRPALVEVVRRETAATKGQPRAGVKIKVTAAADLGDDQVAA